MSAPNQQTSNVPGNDDEKKDNKNYRAADQSRLINNVKRNAGTLAKRHPAATVGYFLQSGYSNKLQGTMRHTSGDTQFDHALLNAIGDAIEVQNRRQSQGAVFNGKIHLDLKPPVQDAFFQTVLHEAEREGILSSLQAKSLLKCAVQIKKEAEESEDFRVKLLSCAGVTSATYLCSET
jgi:hypothetical protein